MIKKNFKFYLDGIEKECVKAIDVVAGDYAGDITLYGGELDTEKLREALEELSPRYPLFLISYVEGDDTRETAISPEPGAPWWKRHDCSFIVIAIDDDARGEDARRGGVFQMISDAEEALEGKQFEVEVEVVGEDEDEKVILNPGEFISLGKDRIAHLPGHAAWSVSFSTYFKYLSPDRRVPAIPVTAVDLILDADDRASRQANTPGAFIE